jgi:hypothetical protein
MVAVGGGSYLGVPLLSRETGFVQLRVSVHIFLTKESKDVKRISRSTFTVTSISTTKESTNSFFYESWEDNEIFEH